MELEMLLNLIKPLVEAYSGELGFLVQVVSIIGSARLLMKPIMALLEVYVVITPSKKDDAWPVQIKESKIFKSVNFVFDWLLSLKLLPKKK